MESAFIMILALMSICIATINGNALFLDPELIERFKANGTVADDAKLIIPFKYPLYMQCDPTWANDLMDTKTVCQVGCLMSSTSMAISGSNILIPPSSPSNSGTLNAWLKANGGYDGSNDFIESVAQQIDPARIVWPSDAMHTTNDLSYSTVVSYLEKGRIVIGNVNQGHHFVLLTGYSLDNDTLAVNDPGYTR